MYTPTSHKWTIFTKFAISSFIFQIWPNRNPEFNEFRNQEEWTATHASQPPTTRGFADVVAITWPDQDEQGNAYVSIQFPGDAAKLITLEPVPEKHRAEIRAYLLTNASRIFVETEEEPVIDGGKSYDDLTSSDYKEYADKVGEAVYAELETWITHDCFEMVPRAGARNILDLRWVGKWKKLKHPTTPGKLIWGIRMRMTQRRFKDEDANGLKTFSGTSSRLSQRIVVSECCCRKW